MFRRGFYLSELIPLLLALGMLGLAIFGLATGRVWSLVPGEFVTVVHFSADPTLFWLSIGIYLLVGATLGVISLRTLRGY
jgi:hypothetical protein